MGAMSLFGSDMFGLDGRAYRVAAWIGLALVAAALFGTALAGEWKGALVLTAFLAAAGGFLVFEDRLPALFDLLLVVAALLNAVGWVWGAFEWPGPYDEVTHAFTTFGVTLTLGFLTFYSVRVSFRSHGVLFVLVIASFGLAIGAFWEIVEWTTGVIGPLDDTLLDLTMDATGALLAGVFNLRALQEAPDDQLSEGSEASRLRVP